MLPAAGDEGQRIAGAALRGELSLKLTGGVAVAITCTSATMPPLARTYADIDLVGRARESGTIAELLADLGYAADIPFNAMHGHRRLLFWDSENGRQVDVFLDEIEMCHRIDLRNRLASPGATLPLADLLLMKLQVVETNDKDYLDIIAILSDQAFTTDDTGINLPYLTRLACDDWGLWRTTTDVARRAADYAAKLGDPRHSATAGRQVERYLTALTDAPKSRKWKLRSRIGDRKRWHELPEEAH
jgi:hypothetical protein